MRDYCVCPVKPQQVPCPARPADQAPLLSLCPPPGLLLATSSLLQRFSLRTWGYLLLTFCSNNTGFHGEALLPKGGVRGYTNTSLIPKRFLFSCGILGSKLVVSFTSQAWSCLRAFALVALLPAALFKCRFKFSTFPALCCYLLPVAFPGHNNKSLSSFILCAF